MAKISYRRLAEAMVELMDKHSLEEVVAAAVEAMTAGGAKPRLERLIPELERELAQQKGHLVIHATTARQLPEELLDELAQQLTEKLEADSYELDIQVDPSLLGGARLTTADRVLDLSIRTKLENIRI